MKQASDPNEIVELLGLYIPVPRDSNPPIRRPLSRVRGSELKGHLHGEGRGSCCLPRPGGRAMRMCV